MKTQKADSHFIDVFFITKGFKFMPNYLSCSHGSENERQMENESNHKPLMRTRSHVVPV